MQILEVVQLTGDKDIEDALDIRRVVFVEGQNVPIERELDGLDVEAQHFVGYIENQPVAVARVRLIEEKKAKIERVGVLEEQRGSGVGFMIMTHILGGLKLEGVTSATLEAQLPAQSFYERLGFTAVGDVFEDAGMPHIKMTRNL